MSQRKPFIQKLERMMAQDERIILIYGDVGFSFMEAVIEKYPNQTLNAGIAEQNMLGMAAGLAHAGWKPYVYTMTNFILLRPLEQLRNDICYPNANVKLFGVKGGESYKFLGMSHNMTNAETKGILYNLPNITTHFPKTEEETIDLIEQEYERKGASYFEI